MIYVKLKEFRSKHGKMKQSDLAKLFGIGQTDVSRMEQGHKLLTDEQYQILIDKFGESDVLSFVDESLLESIKAAKRCRKIKERIGLLDGPPTPQDLLSLVRIITDLQKQNESLTERVKELTLQIQAMQAP